MTVIIKQFNHPLSNTLNPVFCVGDIACEKAGELSSMVIEKMKTNNLIHELDAVPVIDKYFRYVDIISDAKSCTYYELKKLQPNI